MDAPSKVTKTLSSSWDGLSEHLIASFYQVRKVGDGDSAYWEKVEGSPIVKAPLTEASMEMVLNWQSPFEQAGPESKAPALFAMLQSGALQPVIDALNPFRKDKAATVDQEAVNKSNEFLKQFEGRTGITKLNSTQIFNGMPPVKIQVTALFRAWSDPQKEVEQPFEQLMQWALPVQLAGDSTILSRAAETIRGDMGYVEALMPSKSPVRIAMQYKKKRYSPLVIESIGMPLDSPVNQHGHYANLLVPMTLCSLTAIDRKDWRDTQRSEL